jgi:RecB family exonuclease
MKIKADRVDHMEDGRRVLIDYKTGEVDCKHWEGERPENPQLPAYAATTDGDIAAVAFARLKVGKVGFVGYSPDPAVLPCSNDYRKTEPGLAGENSLGPVVGRWKDIVEGLATDYREGRAPVDRLSEDVCKYCALPAICRVEDDTIQPEREEAEDEQ